MTAVLAIDPGPVESAYAIVALDDRRPVVVDKVPNEQLVRLCARVGREHDLTATAVEMVASYGMAVGADVFETCVWIGRYQQTLLDGGHEPDLVYRRDVKLHHCDDSRAKDANITQALVDRFAGGQPNRGKGTKAEPGWFYGFRADIWQAYALAVLVADRVRGGRR